MIDGERWGYWDDRRSSVLENEERVMTTHENCQPCLLASIRAISFGVKALLLTLAKTFPHNIKRGSFWSFGWSVIPFFGKDGSGRLSMSEVDIAASPCACSTLGGISCSWGMTTCPSSPSCWWACLLELLRAAGRVLVLFDVVTVDVVTAGLMGRVVLVVLVMLVLPTPPGCPLLLLLLLCLAAAALPLRALAIVVTGRPCTSADLLAAAAWRGSVFFTASWL